MSWAINGLVRGEFLRLPGAEAAASVGIASTVMAVGLHVLGFHYRTNVVAAMFTIAAVSGLCVTVISAIAYAIISIGMERGNYQAINE